ncbi:MAG: hypothetical protein KAJ19_12655 [Gammaproteobacteria bacterium]|nr:hypothetical protein [Gammaproteobacteria bacterium]
MNDDKEVGSDPCPKCGCTNYRMDFKAGKVRAAGINSWAAGATCRESCPEGEHFHLECRRCNRWTWERPLDFMPGSEPKPRVKAPKKWWQFWK